MDTLKRDPEVLLDSLIERYPVLEGCRQSIWDVFELIRSSYQSGGTLLLCGNGGSAADADHISGELLKGFAHPRPISGEWRKKLGDSVADNLQGALPAIPLTVFPALGTAYGNDCDWEWGFAQLVWGLGREGDILLCLSTSGNSKNVINALEVAHAKGLKVVGMTGEGGGKLAQKADHVIRVPENEVYKIQELHLPIYHALCFMLESAFFD